MTSALPVTGRDQALDGLRGLAALVVFCDHLGRGVLAGVIAPVWLAWPFEGGAAVMVFFVLSGYVIGITCPQSTAAGQVGRYVGRRFVRLVPITLIAVLLTYALIRNDPWVAVGNAFFLQNYAGYGAFMIPALTGNENLWSLNYEAVYYAFFILLWRLNWPLRRIAWSALAVALLGWYTGLLPIFVACYATGFLFWVSGLGLAWHARSLTPENENARWPSALLLLLVTCKLRVLANLLSGITFPFLAGPVVRLYYLDYLPASVWLVAIVTRRQLPWARGVQIACVLIPFVGLVIKWYRPGYFLPVHYWLALGAYLLALLLWPWRPSLRFFRFLAPAGTIAFALYAVAKPVQEFFFAHPAWFPPNTTGYLACVFLSVSVAVGIAWGLERILQPQLNRWLLRSKSH